MTINQNLGFFFLTLPPKCLSMHPIPGLQL